MLFAMPRNANEATIATANTTNTMFTFFAAAMKLYFVSFNILLESFVVNVRFVSLFLSRKRSYTTRVTNTAVKNEHNRPIIKVVAKPLIGPVPKL